MKASSIPAGCALVVVGLAALGGAQPQGALTIELVDADTGRTLDGLVRLANAQGEAVVPVGLLSRGFGLESGDAAARWWALVGRATVRVPRQRLVVEAFSGLETELGWIDVDLASQPAAVVKLPLRRFYSAADQGQRGANTHLHLKSVSRPDAERYLLEVPRADGLDLVFVSYLERADEDREYVSNALTRDDLRRLSQSGVLFGNGQEHRHNFTPFGQGYGHVMLLNLRQLVRPVSLGPGITKTGTDGVPLRPGIERGKRDGATVVWCHNDLGFEDIPSWVMGRPHAQNIFDGAPDKHGSYDRTFYRYLNAGFRVPFSTGTDWFIYDFSRAYVPVTRLASPRDWLRELEAGRSTITNGPFLEFQVDGQAVGDTVRRNEPGRARVSGRALGRVDFRRLELVRDGQVVASAPSRREAGHFRAEIDLELPLEQPAWLALRVPPASVADAPRSELGGALFAHTSPIYVEMAGRGVFRRDAAGDLLAEMKRDLATLQKTALFGSAHERGHVVDVYRQAVAALERKLKP